MNRRVRTSRISLLTTGSTVYTMTVYEEGELVSHRFMWVLGDMQFTAAVPEAMEQPEWVSFD